MCRACDRQERYCPNGHTQSKGHGDVFSAEVLVRVSGYGQREEYERRRSPCDTCGEPTEIRERSD